MHLRHVLRVTAQVPLASASQLLLSPPTLSRGLSTASALNPAAASPRSEERIAALLRERLAAVDVVVRDVSGGCGSFFEIKVVSPLFVGMSVVRQHRAVNTVLEAEIGKMHGLTLKTLAPAAATAATAATAPGAGAARKE